MNDQTKGGFNAWMIVVLILITAATLDFMLVRSQFRFQAISVLRGEFPSAAIVTSQLSLLAIWLGLGNSSIVIRAIVSIAAGAVLMSLVGRDVDPFLRVSVIARMSLPMFAMRLVGFRFDRSCTEEPSSETEIGNPMQFSLKQMFGLTALMAIEALLIGVWLEAFSSNVSGSKDIEEAIDLIWLMIAAFASPALVVIVFRPGKVRRGWLPFLWTVFVGLGCAVTALRVPKSIGVWSIGVWLAIHLGLVIAALLLFRQQGYHLVRVPSPTGVGEKLLVKEDDE